MKSNNLKIEMTELVKFVDTTLERFQYSPDPHWQTCNAAADEFDLWQADRNIQRFPLWLSYVVQGIGRDNGILK